MERMTASHVVRKAPDCRSLSRATCLSKLLRELTQSTGMWTSSPISSRSRVVCVMQAWVSMSTYLLTVSAPGAVL